jgi:HD superfamily phosphohydrolase
MPGGKRKYIYDTVHGGISLSGASLALVGHPQLQRLWGIRQTGLAHLVFPGANHTRLEHSLGVLFLCRAMAQAVGLPEDEVEQLAVAGLLHDLGHTPFSHTLEPVLREETGKGHEDQTRSLILGEGTREGLPPGGRIRDYRPEPLSALLERHGQVPRTIARLLSARGVPGRPYVSEMLHGAIDADRLDYLQRDAHYTGVAHGVIDHHRLLETVDRERGHLVFAEKGLPAVEGFLLARSLMYSSVYYNKTVRIAELMLQGAVERWRDPEREGWWQLTDGDLLSRLLRAREPSGELARRLVVRQLYKRVALLGTDVPPALRGRLGNLVAHPSARREWEDELAHRWGGRPGEVLVDLAEGLPQRSAASGPTAPDPVWVRLNGQVVNLYDEDPVWAAWARRSPVSWTAGLYVSPRLRGRGTREGPSRLLDPP